MSEADIVRRVLLRSRISQLEDVAAAISLAQEEFESHSEDWIAVQGELAELRGQQYSSADRTKLDTLSRSFREQLAEYRLTSIPVNEIDISQATLRPSHEGFDLAFDLSASDAVRTKWAYLTAFLETARAHDANHPGLLSK